MMLAGLAELKHAKPVVRKRANACLVRVIFVCGYGLACSIRVSVRSANHNQTPPFLSTNTRTPHRAPSPWWCRTGC